MRWWDGIIDSIHMSKLKEIMNEGKPGMLQSMGSQKVGHNQALNNSSHLQISMLLNVQCKNLTIVYFLSSPCAIIFI